ncbi:MAG: glycoside hydrolase family 65 protein [Clostridia bacterium]|nr:glycoside hydrolase family 65 protein [Clostridia bacterium]
MCSWVLKENKFDISRMCERESLWTQGNGYMGVRASFEEKYLKGYRATLINGLFDGPNGDSPELAVLPDVTNCDIYINEERFAMDVGVCEDYHASLNMETGEFTRNLTWTSPKGVKVGLAFSRIVSDVRKHIMAQKVTVTALSEDVNVYMVTGIDGKVTNTGVQHIHGIQKRVFSNGVKCMWFYTVQSKVDAAIQYVIRYKGLAEEKNSIDKRSLFTNISAEVKSGESFTMEKIVSFAMGRDSEYANMTADVEKIKADGEQYVLEAAKHGYDGLLSECAKGMKAFWDCSLVEIKTGDDFMDQAMIFAQYHLHIMASRDDNRLGIGAKALSGEGYMGHSFWDTELFILPYYLFNAPEVARRLLEYRYHLLDIAKEKAKSYGFKGAMIPWETAWITDGECAIEDADIDLITGKGRKFKMGSDEIHVSAGVAYAIWQYYCATGDKKFMEQYGNELLVLTALFWATRAEKKNGRYEILGVIGPDEYKEDVNNNAYTNYMAQFNIKLACDILKDCPKSLYDKLSAEYDVDEVTALLNDVCENMYLPQPEEDGIILQFDGCKDLKPVDIEYYKNLDTVFNMLADYEFSEILAMQVYKQADLVMLFYLMEEKFDKEIALKNFEYYEKRTLHDSSLSMCIHSLVAARLGMKEMADKLFYDCCCVDLGANTRNSDGGIHAASIAGIWLAALMGYGGLRVRDDGLYLEPVLPEGWESYSFYACYQGSRIKVMVDENGCTLSRISGDEITVYLNGKEICV